MARAGPNQDINDPTTLEDSRILATSTSVLAREKSELFNGQTLTDLQAVPITIELKLSDGQSVSVDSYQSSLWARTVLNTYIDQAERFRGYWNSLNAYANNIPDPDDIATVYNMDIGPLDCEITDTDRYEQEPPPFWRTFKAQTKICFFPMTVEISGMSASGVGYDPLIEPTWSGNGPTNYNHNTYPQLLNEFGRLTSAIGVMDTSVGIPSSGTLNYRYTESTVHVIYDFPTPNYFNRVVAAQSIRTEVFDTFFLNNPTLEDIQLDIEYSLTVTPGSFDRSNLCHKQIIVGSTQIYLSTSTGDDWEDVHALGGVFVDNKTINIPSKTMKAISFPLTFDASALYGWYLPENSVPANALNVFLSALDLKITIQGNVDSIQFIPSVSV
ncbi:hypothetical protein LCGC14_2339580 [marine sediment metagenome]|uniref:Uncharacterized protein n=1 Tax=marine sediment metagenome TaxID=412755 RepID=A0A0F9CZZ3_9ZZZZ